MKAGVVIGIFMFLVICLCCVGVLVLAGLGYFVYDTASEYTYFPSDGLPSNTPEASIIRPEALIKPESPSSPSLVGVTSVPTDTLVTLQQAIIPVSNLNDLTRRYEGLDIPDTLPPPATWHQVGDQTTFWASNIDTNDQIQIDATLQYVTDHVYFWVEDGITYRENDLQDLATTFENQIYPTNRAFFGSEWTPGVDSDPHIYILYASGLGDSLAGYFSSVDSLHPMVNDYSNGHEMFLFNSDTSSLDDRSTYGTLAHEFQHMIHWYQDRNEALWINEGFAEFASSLNGYNTSGFEGVFARTPDLQLNFWPDENLETYPHYGASALFTSYFVDRFGDQAAQSLIRHPENGLESIDSLLGELNIFDPLRGRGLTADDVVQDWMITNYLQDSSAADGRFDYNRYERPPEFEATERLKHCPETMQTRTVSQYGADYIRISCKGSYILSWTGSIQTRLLSSDPHSGRYALWSNQGDESEMRLTQTFDFRNHTGPLTLNYSAWYDLETDFDYLYLAISENGEDWKILSTPSGTSYNPTGSSFGWGYNGLSGGGETARWIEETVDLTSFAGKLVQIRFDYVTDGAVNKEGFLLDDVAIPEISYFSDFEVDAGGWDMEGWVRIENVLPQTFRLALIKLGEQTSIEYIELHPDITAEIPLEIGGETDEVILVVSGTTRFTRLPALYQFEIK